MALTIDQPLPELDDAQAAIRAEATRDQRKQRKQALGIPVTGEAADAYIDILIRAIKAARLNAIFPPDRPLRTHLSFLAPTRTHGLHPTIELARESGLPVARDIFRVKIDRDLAGNFLADAAERRVPDPDSRLARKIAYYHDLVDAAIMPLSRMRVELRQQVPDENLALFRVTYDGFDIASSLFARMPQLCFPYAPTQRGCCSFVAISSLFRASTVPFSGTRLPDTPARGTVSIQRVAPSVWARRPHHTTFSASGKVQLPLRISARGR